jgi:apolipoprotein N-acyltransferase
VAVAVASAAGAVMSLANPPIDLGPVAFVALVPLLWALREAEPRRGAILGFCFGLVYYAILLSWLLAFGLIAWLPLVVVQAGYAALFGALMPVLWTNGRPLRSALLCGALWTAIDWARGSWPLGGFTWGGFGYSQHGNGLLLPLASVTGVWGITFVVVLVNAVLLEAFPLVRKTPRRAAALAATGLVACLIPALIPIPAAAGPRLRVAVVQGNVPRSLASDRFLQSDAVVQNHIRLNHELQGDPPDLAIWPENALAVDPTVDTAVGEPVADSIRAVGAPTLVGAIGDAPGGRFYNEVLLYSGDGRVVASYVKTHLVPFGEHIPWPAVFGWTQRYREGLVDLEPGKRITLFHIDGTTVGTPICFENTFPDLFRRFVAAGAAVVVVSTNDSTWLESPVSREHVIMSQLRAVENGRWVIQAAISGESAVVDPRGRIVEHTGLFVPAIMRFRVPTSSSRTLYTRLGDWFPWAAGLLVLVILGRALMRARRTGRRSPPAGEGMGAHTGAPGERGLAPIRGGAPNRTLVVLPTYNERETIQTVVAGVMAVDPGLDVLVIDDASPDGTGDLVAALAEQERRCRLLRRGRKLGLASAYLTGFREALEEGYDRVVEMDADLSHQPGDLHRLLDGAAVYDLTIGSRYIAGGAVTNWSRSRVALSKAGNRYARTLLRFPLTDATSGFRVFRRGLLEALLAEGIRSDGYAFQIELAYRAWRSGFKVGEVPITFSERQHGRSKLSRAIIAEALLKVAQWGIRDRLRPGRRA